jgi:putative DNA primase/helicase
MCRLVNCAEPERGQRFTESLVKMITSGDRVDASFKYMPSFEFIPRWKIWVSTNHAPGSGDIAVHRRLKLLPFRHTVPKNREDTSLKPWLKDPDRGGRVLLSWAVEGARGWYADGLQYAETAVAQEWMDEYVEDEDPVGLFISMCLQPGTLDKELWPGTKELYAVFERWNWSELQNTRVMGFQRFNQALQERNIRRGKHPETGKRVWREVSLTWDPNTASL